MGSLKNFVRLLSICVILFLGCFVDASWQKEACVVDKNCGAASNNYTEPYCFSNDMGENAAINVNNCVWMPLANSLSSKGGETKEKVIENYCLSLYGNSGEGRIYFAKPSSIDDSGWDWQQTFDSHQSLFLYALCSSFTKSGNNHPFVNNNALVKDVFTGNLVKILNLEQMSEGNDLCSLEGTGFSKCDMSIYATKIYSSIMSDLYKIKYAQVLHVDASEGSSGNRKSKIEDFMAGYSFSKKNEVEKYQDLKNYTSKTISILKSNQMYYKKVLDTVKIIDNSMLASRAMQTGCSVTGNMVGADFVACALHSSQKNGLASTPAFLTLVYNEILNYRQFVVYYDSWLKKTEKQNKLAGLDLESERLDLAWYADKQIEATKSAQQDFQDFSMTYPLHIGILMYMERVEKFRNTNLSKIITSFYSLSEKLQNVQEPSS